MRTRPLTITRRILVPGMAAVMMAPSGVVAHRAPAPARTLERSLAGPAVLLISIDGLRPEYILDSATYRGTLPNLRRMLRDGAYATGVHGVLPTVTYPSHTTLITGVSPARHGIVANTTFDPDLRNQGGWYWYASDITAPTLWDASASAGLRTANIHWPVSVGANVTLNLPQYWRTGTPDDRKLLRALATPGLVDRLERELGPYADGADESIEGDENRARFAERLLDSEQLNFTTAYFTALDHEQHKGGPLGPGNPDAMLVLERIDGIVGRLSDALHRRAGRNAAVVVVSDHGFAPATRELNLLPVLHDAGLLDADSTGHITAWRAGVWPAGGSVGIVLKDAADASARRRVWELVDRLRADTAYGIARVMTGRDLSAAGAFPGAEVVLALRPGFTSGAQVIGTVLHPSTYKGMHGYSPDVVEMRSSFFVVGPGIARGHALGEIDMRDIAPTIAGLLGVALPSAERRDLFSNRSVMTPASRP